MKPCHALFLFLLVSSPAPGDAGTIHVLVDPRTPAVEAVLTELRAATDDAFVLEVRYSAATMEARDARVLIDGLDAGTLGLWGCCHAIRLYPNGSSGSTTST